ncbi:MAG: hypothetical protein WAJ85_02135 [Candidatus Baltobacteraceae bacterium]|jgi:hypothetical protein
MKRAPVIATALFAFGAWTGPPAAAAAETAFSGPADWSHSGPTVSPDGSRTVDQWHLSGDVQSLTFIRDATTSYADALAAIEQNFAAQRIKATIDKDLPCDGKTGHVVEFTTGPDGHRVAINRILVPDGSGVVTLTYTRDDGSRVDDEVKKAETSYCGPAPK